MTKRIVSELTSAAQLNNTDLFLLSQGSAGNYASLNTTLLALASKIVANTNYTSDLHTNSKTITGALNEIFNSGNLADTYDTTETYEEDDYCIYQGLLYKCIAETTGAFDTDDWVQTTITDELAQGGGGGTTVIANPTGTPTEELNSIQIGNDIYEIVGGGGGGSASWKDITGTLVAGQTEITLSDASIAVDSTFEPFTDKFGVNPTDMEFIQGAETVLQPLVTQESELIGTVTVASTFSDYSGWKAFTATDGWVGTGSIDQWLAYEFPTDVTVSAIKWNCADTSRRAVVTSIQYSNDGTTWNDCTLSKNERGDVEISSVNSAKHWRLFFAATVAAWTEPMIGSLEFIAVTNGVKLTFPVQSENLNVKVRVS